MNILGIHGGVTVNQHDAGAALVVDGKLVCFVEEERLIRVKTATGTLPVESISACLRESQLTIHDIDLICLSGETYEDIILRTEEWLKHHFGYAPKIIKINHHTAHLASAFYQSRYEQAMCLSVDAYGDGLSGAIAIGDSKTGLNVIETIPALNSLGIFYSTITSFLGFRPGEDEYKVMGLAPYGSPVMDLSFFCKPIPEGFYCDPKYFRSRRSATVYEPYYSQALIDKIGNPRRKDEPIHDKYKNIAASAQNTLESCLISLVTKIFNQTGQKNLCLAGGVALNCSANRLLSELPFIDNFFVQPAASDRGLPLGCALHAAFLYGEKIQPISHVFYGPTYSLKEIESALNITGVKGIKIENPAEEASKKIANGQIVGWYQGRSEFGPRALGHRSILVNPSIANMKDEINKKVKFREEFRPFAPAVLEEDCFEIFEMKAPSPYMTIAHNIKPPWNLKMPATTHINNTGRVQTVDEKSDPLFYSLIKDFKSKTSCPAVLNTSFNIKGQPIVEKPIEAISTFFGTGLDAMFIENYMITKTQS